ncbi:serine/threonine-protein kinase [Vairimorpha necatrix]|uniref:non-specific serine/threonine protein kinase n=1 Tax=Vairimorpha necatrix TaxID=6039 RepID=A0AAX4JFE6_9MICR
MNKLSKFMKFCYTCRLEILTYTKHNKKRLIISIFFSFLFFFFLKIIFFNIFGDMKDKQESYMKNKQDEKEEIYDFINKSVDLCLKKKTRYEQNKKFNEIISSLPIKPIKMTLTTSVFLLNNDKFTVLKRIIVNKKTPIFEDKIALRLDHFNIVKSYKSEIRSYRDMNNETQTIIWLYMEYLPFKISQGYVKKNEEIIKEIAYDLLLGLEYLHKNNIAHLDLKIANIMGFKENDKMRYKIIDFGYSRVVDKEVFIPGKQYGTFPYKPPEVVFESIHGLKGDIWCVGAILLFLRLEETPFYDSSNKKDKPLYDKFLSGRYKIKYPQGISPVLKDFIKACMRLDRNKRPSVEELLTHKLFREKGVLFGDEEVSSDYYSDSEYDETDESIDIDL